MTIDSDPIFFAAGPSRYLESVCGRLVGRLATLGLTVLAVCLLAGCAGKQLMPTPNVYVDAPNDPFANVVPQFRTNRVDVLYITDRQPKPKADGTMAYGAGRSPSLAFGSCEVAFGQDVSWDTLVGQSRQRERSFRLPVRIRSLTEQGRFPATPLPVIRSNGHYQFDPVAQATQERVAKQLQQTIRERLALTARKDAYVYIHGYNNSFEDAAFVIAELWHFLGREGVPILYTWPAGGGEGT